MKFSVIVLIRNVFAYICVAILILFTGIPCLLIACLPKNFRYRHALYFFFVRFFYWGCLRSLLVPLEISGQENIINEPVLFIANHQSALDIPLVGYAIGKRYHLWLVLSYYVKYPLLGFLIKRMNVPVEQDKSMKAARALIAVLRIARDSQQDLIIFPEGSRYIDGKVHDFFDGYALIIEKTKRPLIPLYIKNNYKILPRGSWFYKPFPLSITIGPVFRINEHETYEQFNARVRDWFLGQ